MRTKFAERDRPWEDGDPAYLALSDALQYLGNVAFREPVSAYKHSAAVFLHLVGRIPSDLTHPKNRTRPPGSLKYCGIASSAWNRRARWRTENGFAGGRWTSEHPEVSSRRPWQTV